MTLITGEVYDYILDEVQQSTVQNIKRMTDVIEHLKLQHGSINQIDKYVAKAVDIQNTLQLAAANIDQLPALGADLEKLVAQPEEKAGLVVSLSEAQAVEKVGRRMTRGAVEKALLEHYDAEMVRYEQENDRYIIILKEEES